MILQRTFPHFSSLALFFLVACAPEELVVGNRTGPALNAERCRESSECGTLQVCTKAACGDAVGFCEARQSTCGTEFFPSCGCDGITYFNDCLRAASGASLRAQGECGRAAARCGEREGACPADAFCARLDVKGPACRDNARTSGTCWVVPSRCESSAPAGADLWRSCAGPGGSPSGSMGKSSGDRPCVDTCTAIRSEVPHERQFRCQ
jgi:Kazal-type serine protease inhibitor domain